MGSNGVSEIRALSNFDRVTWSVREHTRRTGTHSRNIGSVDGLANALANKAGILATQNRSKDATDAATEAMSIAEEFNLPGIREYIAPLLRTLGG